MNRHNLKRKIGRAGTNYEKHHKVKKEAKRKEEEENESYLIWAKTEGFRVQI